MSKRKRTKNNATTPPAKPQATPQKKEGPAVTHGYRGTLVGPVPKGRNFILPSGEQVKSLLELVYRLDTMPETYFSHHTKSGRNDFATWVKNVYKDDKLAARLEGCQHRHEYQLAILKQMVKNLRE